MPKMLQPKGQKNVKYNEIKVAEGVPVEILDQDVEDLRAEGWTMAEVSEPPRAPSLIDPPLEFLPAADAEDSEDDDA